MKTDTLKPLKPLLISLSLLAATVLSPIRAEPNPPNAGGKMPDQISKLDREEEPQQPGNIPAPKAKMEQVDAQIDILESRINELEREKFATDESGFLGISWGPLLNTGSPLLGLISLLLALVALSRVKKQREEVIKLKGRYQNLLTRLGGVEVQMEQERMTNRNQVIAVSAPTTLASTPTPTTLASTPTPTPPTQPSRSIAQPAPETNPGPEPISKGTLISALNAGDRQPIRAAASAELNITSESENALAMGRGNSTELEEVPGGGSYWLVSLQGQHWLFPTDRTLKGFAAAQPAKGLFDYEQQTIAQPQLVEPALLENSGTRWSVKTTGRIVVP
jgi:hypothetical protein